MYKKQIQELHEKVLADEMKMKKLEYEYKGVEERHMQTQQLMRVEKERIQLELEHLKESHEQLVVNSQIFQLNEKNQPDELAGLQNMDGPFSSVELVNIPSETK